MQMHQNFFRSLLISGSLRASRSRANTRSLLFMAVPAMLAMTCMAQSPTGTIRGTILDSSGAVVPNATITITNTQTNEVKTAKSDNEGRYIINFVQPATYTATATAPGFETQKQNNIIVQVSVGVPVDFKLPVANVAQNVQVTSTTPALEASTSSVNTVITAQQIVDLPLNGRNPTSLEVLVPGVSTVGGASTPHIAGSRNGNNEEQIDGMTNILPENNVGNNETAYTPIVDSVQEFNVQTSVLPAQYGRFSGGVISLVTKSGTNKFHGTAFDFTQTQAFYAKGYFQTGPNAPSHLYQSGGTIGGPITIPHLYSGHDKSFFFFAFEDSRQASEATYIDTVPTAAERTGDFSGILGGPLINPTTGMPYVNPCTGQNVLSGQIFDPTTARTAVDPTTGQTVYCRTPFANNMIPATGAPGGSISKVASAAIGYFPLPNAGAGALTNNYNTTGSTTNNYYHFDLRLDHDFGPKWHSFVRFSHLNNPNLPYDTYGNAADPTGNGPSITTAYSASFDNAITLSPTLVMDLRAGFSRQAETRTTFDTPFNVASIGLPPAIVANGQKNASDFPYFDLTTNGFSSLGSGNYVNYQENPSAIDVDPSFVKVLHGNSITFGGEYRKLFLNFYQYGYPTGDFGSISSDWTEDELNNTDGSGNAAATMLLGLADGGEVSTDTTLATSSTYDALYVQDDYQAAPSLTFNIGLRWDVDIPRTERHNKLDYWDPTLPSPLAGVIPASACATCANLVGQMVFVGTPGAKYGRHQAPTQWKDFAPRVGFAWSADDKTVVRGGYGLVYQASALQAAGTSGGAGTDGFTSSTSLDFTNTSEQTINTTFDNPIPNGLNEPLGAAGGPSTFIGQSISDTFFNSVRNPYTIQGNLNVQRALPLQTVLEVGYLYNRGNFLIDGDPGVPYSQVNPSYLPLGQALLNSVPNPFYGKITTPGSILASPTVPLDYLLKAFPQYTSVYSYRKADSGSHYNAITLKLDKRMSHGLSLLVSYTGSKMMDNAASAVSYLGPSSGTYANQFNPKAEFGLSTQDVSRLLSIGYVYELPFGRGQQFLAHENGWVDHLIGGWQTNGLIQSDTGTPIVLSGAQDNTGLLTLGQRPTELPGDPNISNKTLNHYFNTAIFVQPAKFTIGNAPRALPNARNPGYTDADLSLFKNNFLGSGERYNIQFRLEAFNALNHPNFSAPDTGVNDGTKFGQITGEASNNRELQLAVKFLF